MNLCCFHNRLKGHLLEVGKCFFCLLFILAFALAILSGISNGLAQEPEAVNVRVDVETDRGFGRFSLSLPDRTKFLNHTISTDDNVVVLRLDEPINIDLVKAAEPLKDYVLIARQDPEGTVLRFALAAGVRVNTLAAGEHFYIDFLPRTWTAENPSIPEDVVRKLESRAEAALALAKQNALLNSDDDDEKKVVLNVRLGRHPTFSRFVFSWNVPYGVSFKREDDIAILVFDKVGKYDFGPINAAPPAFVKRIIGQLGKDQTIVRMKLDKKARIRSYIDGDDYIIDITGDQLDNKNGAPFVIGGLPAVPDTARDVSQVAPPSIAPRGLAEDHAQIPQETQTRSQTIQQENKQGDPPSAVPRDGRENNALKNVAEEKDKSNSEQLTGEQGFALNPEKVDEADKKVQGVSAVEASINENNDALRVVFPFDKQTPSAIFRRDKSVWMVFLTEDEIDISGLDNLKGEFLRKVEIIEKGNYKAVRIVLPTAQLASAAIDENSWIVSIGNSVIRASEPLIVERQLSEQGLFLNVTLNNARGSEIFTDPDVGDKVHVVVADPPSRGLIRSQKFVMLTILPSTHAVAFVPLGDTVRARIEESGVAIESSERALNLSTLKELRASASGKIITGEWYDEPLEITTADKAERVRFATREADLINQIISASDEELPKAHLSLAKFYVANHYGPEALANIDRALAIQPLLENKRTFVLSRAAAQITMGRFDDAIKTLGEESYHKDQDAAVWRTIAAVNEGKWSIAAESAVLGKVRLSSYYPETQQDFFLSAAKASLVLKDLSSAKNYLSNLVLRDASRYNLGRYELLQAQLAIEEGRNEDARFFYNRAVVFNDPRIVSEARLGLIDLNHKTGKVANKDTIEEYEKFVAIWRNDDLELQALRNLSGVLAEEGEYRKAFKLVKTATISDNTSSITYGLQDDMKALFVDLFHDGKADNLEPIEALSLYYDFKHLTPIGRVGDEIVRYLSRRLVDLDLLPQAADLLQHQIDKRLKGSARARVAADLAVVQLLDHEPHKAITTIHKTRSASIPATLKRQRRLVEAYALSEIGKYDIALELLESLEGGDVNRLRANINWDARRWSAAGELLEKAHSGRWADVDPLEPHVRLDIMRAAIAFSLGKDDFALNRLNQKFGQKMAESQDASIFQVLVQPQDEQSFERDVAVDSILNIGTVDSFLRDYRRRYLSRTRNALPKAPDA